MVVANGSEKLYLIILKDILKCKAYNISQVPGMRIVTESKL
jgi:hypothetical protein